MVVSNTADTFLSLFNIFLYLGIVVGVVVIGLIVYLVIRYREKDSLSPDPEDTPAFGKIPLDRGKAKILVTSLLLSSMILAFLIIGSFGSIDTLDNPPDKGTLTIDVTAFQWAFKFTYPNGYEEIGALHVPINKPVILNVTSQDVFHTLGIVEFKIKIDAIPGRFNSIWFVANESGKYSIRCAEFCGVGHSLMKTDLIVMNDTAFNEWYNGLGV